MKKNILFLVLCLLASIVSLSAMERNLLPKPDFSKLVKKRSTNATEQKVLELKLHNFEKVMSYCSRNGHSADFFKACEEYSGYFDQLDRLSPNVKRKKRSNRIIIMMSKRLKGSQLEKTEPLNARSTERKLDFDMSLKRNKEE